MPTALPRELASTGLARHPPEPGASALQGSGDGSLTSEQLHVTHVACTASVGRACLPTQCVERDSARVLRDLPVEHGAQRVDG